MSTTWPATFSTFRKAWLRDDRRHPRCQRCLSRVPSGCSCRRVLRHLRCAACQRLGRRPRPAADRGLCGGTGRARAAAVRGQLAVSAPAASLAHTVSGGLALCCFWRWSRLALLRWQAPLIAVSALGLPLLFVFYLHESDVFRDLPVRSLVLTAVLGVGARGGWALVTGGIVADPTMPRWAAWTSTRHARLRKSDHPERSAHC